MSGKKKKVLVSDLLVLVSARLLRPARTPRAPRVTPGMRRRTTFGCCARTPASARSQIIHPLLRPSPESGRRRAAGATRRPRARIRQIHAAGAGAGAAFAG